MAVVKLMVMYPCPHDIEVFEKLYQDEDVPMGEGLSSEYAMTFEAFEKLYQEEHVPMSSPCRVRHLYHRAVQMLSTHLVVGFRGNPRLSCDSLAAWNAG